MFRVKGLRGLKGLGVIRVESLRMFRVYGFRV